jgi:hypothetical protein
MPSHTKTMESALAKLISLLGQSEESFYSDQSPNELIEVISTELRHIRKTGKIAKPDNLLFVLAPTNSLQDISIDNGWGDEFLKIAEQIEGALDKCR